MLNEQYRVDIAMETKQVNFSRGNGIEEWGNFYLIIDGNIYESRVKSGDEFFETAYLLPNAEGVFEIVLPEMYKALRLYRDHRCFLPNGRWTTHRERCYSFENVQYRHRSH